MTVLEIATDDASEQAKALTLALRQRVRESKEYALADADLSLQVISLALKCGEVPNAACQGKIATKIKTERYLWGVMKKVPGAQVSVELHLWQRGRDDVAETFVYSDNLTEARDAALLRLSEKMHQRLVSFGKVGTFRITANQFLEGDLFVNGKDQGKFRPPTVEVTVPAGSYRFEVYGAGRLIARAQATSSPTETREVVLQPVSENAPEVIAPRAATERSSEDVNRTDWHRPAGFASLGVGAAAIALGIYGSAKVKQNDTTIQTDPGIVAYRSTILVSDDACEIAKRNRPSSAAGAAAPGRVAEVCQNASTWQTLQYVFYGLGAAFVGTGAYFLLAPSSAAKRPERTGRGTKNSTSWRVWPSGSSTGARVDLRVTFLPPTPHPPQREQTVCYGSLRVV